MTSNNSSERPWSLDEIIENSENWNLAGDVALLNSLKAFADKLLSKTNEINGDLQNLTNGLDETSLRLNIAQNEFQSLRNTQFIESRVYEDDESLPQVEEKVKIEEKNDHTEDIKLAALKGLQVLDEYFDKVEVSVSDSEDEDINLPNYILRPKDFYIHRPLPYVIGSDDWHKNWHVGLEDSSSDSETEKVSDKFSESSEDDLPIIQDRSQIKGSDTSSEFDFSQKNEPKVNSSGSENSIIPVNFAEQLAAKLDNVIQDYEPPEVNTRPIQPPNTNYGDIFFDEPPPLDEPKGLFSGGAGLFDDEKIESPKVIKSGLFDESNSSDDDIFINKKTSKTLIEASIKAPLFNEEPPALDEKKKPIGGVSIFGGGNIFDKKLLKRQQSSEDEEKEVKKVDLFDDLFTSSPKSDVVTEKITKKVNLFDSDEEDKNIFVEKKSTPVEKNTNVEKKISLFDDDDDLFKDDLFSTTNTKKSFTSGLFDDIPGDDLFAEKASQSTDLIQDNNDTTDTFNTSLFTESDDKNSPQDLFAEKSKPEVPIPAKRQNLFEKSDDLFEKNPKTSPEIPNMRLFDPSPPPDDDWDTKSETFSENDDFLHNFEESKNTKSDLFSEEPPSLDFKTTSPKKPGKLKHNLNINVGALMPGYVPLRKSLLDDVIPTPADVIVASLGEKKSTSFDETDNVEVLQSVTKDRVKVPLKRRPSTRRGRQAALRNSVIDFQLNQEETEEKPVIENVENKSLFEEAFKTALFEVKNPPESDDLIEEAKSPDLFETPKKSSKSNLFDDDDEDDLFTAKKTTNKLKKSLFDDEDDDDIFKTFSTSSVKTTETKTATEKKLRKMSAVKKLENTKPDDDPLSALLK